MRLSALGVILLLIAGLILVHNLHGRWDLAFGDETMYLGSGINFKIPFPGGAQWGPVYAAWYAFWHLFVPDRLDLYYFNWGLLSILSGILVFLFLRSFKVVFWASLWLAALYLFSTQNLPINPKISILPFCLILSCLAVGQYCKNIISGFETFLLVAFTGLLCAYIRPEFYISFVLALGVTFYFALKEKVFRSIRSLYSAIILAIVTIGMHLLFGNPLTSGGGNRSTVAFQQHFVVNYCAWQGIPEPLTLDGQIELFHQVLGNDVESITDAMTRQPQWTLKHIGSNVSNSLNDNLQNLFDIVYYTPLEGLYSSKRIFIYGALVLLLILVTVDLRRSRIGFSSMTTSEKRSLLALLILIFPSLTAAVLVYPRTHYLVFHLILLFWIFAIIIVRLVFRMPWSSGRKFIQVFSAVNIAAFVFFLTLRYFQTNKYLPTPTAENVRFITALQPATQLNILERDWYRVFLPYFTTWVHVEGYKNENFGQFVKSSDVNFILMTSDMQQFFAKDASFQNFKINHASYGFEKVETNDRGDYLLFKKGTLK